MKPPAVIAYLWPGQFAVLEPFFARYGPATILCLGAVPEQIRAVAASHGSHAIGLDMLLPRGYDAAQAAAPVLEELRAHLSGSSWLADDLGGPGLEVMRGVIEKQIALDVPPAVRALDALEAAREKYNLVLFVTIEDVTKLTRPATEWANAHGVPTLHISHAIALADPNTVHAHLAAERLAVYGMRGAEGFLDLGIAPERIAITGNPGWDAYAGMADRRPQIRAHLDAKHGLDPSLPLVGFGTTWGGHQTALEPPGDVNLASLQAFVDACEELARLGVRINAVVKDRPTNAAIGEKALARALSTGGPRQQRFVRTGDDTREFAVAADVLVAVDSNYLVEAMLVGTPAINLVSDRLALLGPTFDEESGVVEAESHELAEAIRRLIEDDDHRAERIAQSAARADYYNHGITDGRSAERVGALMAEMALRPMRSLVLVGDVYRRARRLAGRTKRFVRRAFRGGTT
jgi:hypothetical protein